MPFQFGSRSRRIITIRLALTNYIAWLLALALWLPSCVLNPKVSKASLAHSSIRQDNQNNVVLRREFVAKNIAGNHRVVSKLISELYLEDNRSLCLFTMVPGGEVILFTSPIVSLIKLGAETREDLHKLIQDPVIQDDVVLILGAVGDKSTVPLLINAYPNGDNQAEEKMSPSVRRKIIYFTFALTYLTGEPIGRDRSGADFDPQNRHRWMQWWKANQAGFVVPHQKPQGTWVPDYAWSMLEENM